MKCKIQKAVLQYLETKSDEDMAKLYAILKKYTSYTIAKDYVDNQEAESEINEVIAISLMTYDPARNILFKTYFWTNWHNFKGTQKIRQNAKKRQGIKEVVSLNKKLNEDIESGKELQDTIKCKRNDIGIAIDKIDFYNVLQDVEDQKDKTIIQMIYEGSTQTEIAEVLKMSTAGVCIRLKRIATKPYANKLYMALKGK